MRPTLVLIHAYPFHSIMWEPQRAALADTCDIYTPDLPGFRAQPRLDGDALTMQLAAQWIAGELEARSIERCVIGGLSMGGYVAFECWRQFPQKIAGLVLADTKAEADTDQARAARYAAVERIGAGQYEAYVEETITKLLSDRTVAEHPEMVRSVCAIAMSVLPETAIAALLGMAQRADSTDLLPTISVPTAIIVGEEDSVTPVADAVRMADAIPLASLNVLPGAGHLSNIERAAMFNRAIETVVGKAGF